MQSSSYYVWCCAGELSHADCHALLQPAQLLSCAAFCTHEHATEPLSTADFNAQLLSSQRPGQRLRQRPFLIRKQRQRQPRQFWQWSFLIRIQWQWPEQ